MKFNKSLIHGMVAEALLPFEDYFSFDIDDLKDQVHSEYELHVFCPNQRICNFEIEVREPKVEGFGNTKFLISRPFKRIGDGYDGSEKLHLNRENLMMLIIKSLA